MLDKVFQFLITAVTILHVILPPLQEHLRSSQLFEPTYSLLLFLSMIRRPPTQIMPGTSQFIFVR